MLWSTLALSACDRPAERTPTPSADWLDFEGSWNAAGTRRVIPIGEGRTGSIVDLRGTMLLTGAGRPGVGFRAEVVGLVDSRTGVTARSVWTDERGDQVFSELAGEGTGDDNHITGTFLGGTGRYAGATGTFEFSWLYVIESDDGSIQGRAVGLRGRYRLGRPAPESDRP